MKITFNFMGLECVATGSIEDGHFVPDTINATGEIDTNEVSGKMFDELQDKMDSANREVYRSISGGVSANRGYVDNTSYFGE